MSHAAMIDDIHQDGEHWLVTIRGISDAGMLSMEMFPYGGPPYGVTTVAHPDPQDHELTTFTFGGLTSDTLQHMAPEYAQAFRDAGLAPHHNTLALEGAPVEGMVRTWFADSDQPWDMSKDEAVALHVDNFVDASLPELTVYEPVDSLVITFEYANGMKYPMPLHSIAMTQDPAERLLNHSNYLVIPADESLAPVISARTCPNMAGLRIALNERDAEMKNQQIEIGFMVYEYAKTIKSLAHGAKWKSPVEQFQSGLGKK